MHCVSEVKQLNLRQAHYRIANAINVSCLIFFHKHTEVKSHHNQIVFYLYDAEITWRTSPNIYNLPEYKSHHDQIVLYWSNVDIT